MPIDKYGFDNILNLIDPLSKTNWLIPYKSNIIGKEAYKLYYNRPFRLFSPL